MFLPYKVDVPMARWPWANWVLIGLTIVISVAMFGPLTDWSNQAEGAALLRALGGHVNLPAAEGTLHYFLLQPGHFHPAQLVGNLFIHAGWLHLAGNMLFLWVFGNAVNAKLGQWQYVALYLGIGVLESVVWMIAGPGLPSLGASGAIMGIVGAFLLVYPLNDVSMLFTLFFFFRVVRFSAGWLIAAYVAFDLWGLMTEKHAAVAYLSHVVGFLTGAGVTAGLLWWRILDAERGERSLLQVAGWMEETEEELDWRGRPVAQPKKRATATVRVPATPTITPVGPRVERRKRDEGPIPLE